MMNLKNRQRNGIQITMIIKWDWLFYSYLDGEYPDKMSYDNTRRIKRGLFRSNDGTLINADVNAAYQIIKTTGRNDIRIKRKEQILKLNVD